MVVSVQKKEKKSKFERSMRAQGKRSRLHRSRSRKVRRGQIAMGEKIKHEKRDKMIIEKNLRGYQTPFERKKKIIRMSH